jgi:hypothetical protein
MSRRKQLPPTHPLRTGPEFANSSRFHAASFQRRASGRRQDGHQQRHPGDLISSATVSNRLTIHHLAFIIQHLYRPALPFDSVPPSQIAEDRLPRRHERESFRQVPSAGTPRIRALAKLPPSRRPQNQSDLCRSGQAAGLTPARHLPGDGPHLTQPAQVGKARPRAPARASSLDELRAGVAQGMQYRSLRTTPVCCHSPPR